MNKEQPDTKWIFNLNTDVAWHRRRNMLEVGPTDVGLLYINEFGAKATPSRPTLTPADLHKSSQGITVEKTKMDCQNEGPFNPPAPSTPEYYKGGEVQVWDLTRYMSGDMAQAFQYIYRAGVKGDEAQDIRKAIDFIRDWAVHPDVPRSIIPEDIVPTDGPSIGSSLLLSIPENCRWKIRPLIEIVSADSYEGESIGGFPFCGRRLVAHSTIPLLQERLKSIEW